MIKKISLFILVCFLILVPYSTKANHGHRGKQIEPSGELFWFDGSDYCRFILSKTKLPEVLLARLVKVITFALENGIAREFSEEDMDHAHILFRPERRKKDLKDADAILLHTQERSAFSPELLKKRNILLRSDDRIEILRCKTFYTFDINGRRQEHCVIHPHDLRMEENVNLRFVYIDDIPESELSGYEANLRVINGHKILFGVVKNFTNCAGF